MAAGVCVARLLLEQRGVFVIKISTPSSLSSVEREERNFLSAKAAGSLSSGAPLIQCLSILVVPGSDNA
jgi:hypothetical protein